MLRVEIFMMNKIIKDENKISGADIVEELINDNQKIMEKKLNLLN